jgi:hypothetical protein
VKDEERAAACARILHWLDAAYPIHDEGFLKRMDEALYVVHLVLDGPSSTDVL